MATEHGEWVPYRGDASYRAEQAALTDRNDAARKAGKIQRKEDERRAEEIQQQRASARQAKAARKASGG